MRVKHNSPTSGVFQGTLETGAAEPHHFYSSAFQLPNLAIYQNPAVMACATGRVLTNLTIRHLRERPPAAVSVLDQSTVCASGTDLPF